MVQQTGAAGFHEAEIEIVLRALEEPLRQIVANAGGEPSVVLAEIMEGKGSYRTIWRSYEMALLDPTKVMRSALQNAASIASLILTTDAMVADMPKDEEKPAALDEMAM